MKRKNKLLRPFWALGIAIAMLASCSSSPSYTGDETKVYSGSSSDGVPTTVTIQQVDHIDPPADFESRKLIKADDPKQNEKFIFDAQPGDSIAIVNPSTETISSSDIESAVTIKDAYASKEEAAPKAKYLVEKVTSTNKKFRVCDPQSKRPIKSLAPSQKALLVTEEPTEGGDLTVYSKNEYLPINFDGKSSTVNELIVATTREEVEEYDPNDEEIPALLNSEVANFGDLGAKLEGSFLYKKPVNLKEGDQFFIGDHETFDHSATFFTFLSSTKEGSDYRIRYTAPDYSICFNKFNIHHQDQPLDFNDPSTQILMPSEEDIIRQFNGEGGILDTYGDQMLASALLADPIIGPSIRKKLTPGISLNFVGEDVSGNIAINFAVDGPTVVTDWTIYLTWAIKTKEWGSLHVRGSFSMYFKKTFSTFMDYKIKWWPYPKLDYAVCIKTYDELSILFAAGVAAAVKTNKDKDEDYDPGKQMEALQKAIRDIFPDKKSEQPIENAKLPNNLRVDGDDKNAKTGVQASGLENANISKAKFVGDGLVIEGPSVLITVPYVQIKLATAFYLTPTIQGRLYYSYSRVSTSVMAKVVSGFEEPEGYDDDVEESRGQHSFGIIGQLGLEIGFIFELRVFPTGCEKIFRVALMFTAGIYITLTGVFMVTLGSTNTVMGYASIEIGAVRKVNIRLVINDKTWIIDLKTWSWKNVWFAFGTNLHFIDFVDDRDEIDWAGGKYLNINDFGILTVTYFSTASLTVGAAPADWNYEAIYSVTGSDNKKRLFTGLEIKEGAQYIKFDDSRGVFEVLDGAPEVFDFKIKITTEKALGWTMPDKTVAIHYASSEVRRIIFEGYENPELVDDAYVGGGNLKQGDVYVAPSMPAQEDGTPLAGWVGDNGLFLKAGESMIVGSSNITFRPLYRAPNLYVVNFYDGNNNLIVSEKIAEGGSAEEPIASVRDAKMGDATFVGWDRSFNNIHSNINVYGIYAKGGKQA